MTPPHPSFPGMFLVAHQVNPKAVQVAAQKGVVYKERAIRESVPAQEVFFEHPSCAQYFGRFWGVHVLAKEFCLVKIRQGRLKRL